MSLSIQVVRELQRELGELLQRRESLNVRIKSIELIVRSADPRQGRLHGPLESRKSHVGDHAAARKRGALRATVLEILNGLPGGGDAQLVTERLRAHGFNVGGSTSLRQRVSHELARLSRLGVL